ncbi:MAG: hypothetical protein R6V27_02850 [Balneolaceae bacterium]
MTEGGRMGEGEKERVGVQYIPLEAINFPVSGLQSSVLPSPVFQLEAPKPTPLTS